MNNIIQDNRHYYYRNTKSDLKKKYDPKTWSEDYDKKLKLRKEKVKEISDSNEKLFNELRKLKISKVYVEYDGYGDSGAIDGTTFYASEDSENYSEGEIMDICLPKDKCFHMADIGRGSDKDGDYITSSDVSLADAIEHLCYSKLDYTHPGWEINEGSRGTFTFDVNKEKISLQHFIKQISEEECNETF